jgi:hypothetical protein
VLKRGSELVEDDRKRDTTRKAEEFADEGMHIVLSRFTEGSMKGLARFCLAILALIAVVPWMYASEGDDIDNYKWRVDGLGWFSHPTGSFHGANNTGEFDINRDFGFGNYITFAANIDYRFRRKHHLVFTVAPVTSSKDLTLNRTIEFQGKTFDLGAQVSTQVRSFDFAPGYQYDILRRSHGYLALLVQTHVLKTDATITAKGSASGSGGSGSAAASASGSIWAPLPVIGPAFRWYPLHNSNRLSLDGSALGMSFFGYGNFITAQGTVGVAMSRHWNARFGYQMGSRLRIKGTSDRIGVQLTQQGPIAGIEATWGKR